jgi:hypothetical protein
MRFVEEAKMQTQQHLPVIGYGNPLRRDRGVGSRVRRDFSLRTGPRPPKYRLFPRTPRHFPRPIIRFPRAISGFPRHRTLSPGHLAVSPGHLAVSPGDLGRSPVRLDALNASEVASSEQFMRFNSKSVVGRVTPCAPVFADGHHCQPTPGGQRTDRPACHFSVKPSKHIKNATNIKT